MKIAYQGIPGSFTYIAAQHMFSKEPEFKGTTDFKEIFQSVQKGESEYGVMPIENTLAGSIYENFDHLKEYDLHIVGEYNLAIRHYLVALKGKTVKTEKRIDSLTKVFSHIKALEQCEKFFTEHPAVEKIVFSDTARAAKFVAESGNLLYAAISSKEAAELYNLTVLKKNIEDNQHNYTRFVAVSKKMYRSNDVNKGSVLFTLPHTPGSLSEAIQILATNGINLTKIESRPIAGTIFEYYFYVDFEFTGKKLKEVEQILNKLKKYTNYLQILGFYKAAVIPKI